MKGLLRKDLYILTHQMRIFLFMFLVMSVANTQLASFAVMYAAMMPYTTLAYDEQSRWHQLAPMLPCRPLDIVLSKYILGWGLIAATTAFSLLVNALLGRLYVEVDPITVLSSLALACICMASLLPVMFRLGVERGRMVYVLCIAVIFSLVGVLSNFNAFTLPVLRALPAVAAAAAVVISAISVPLSVKMYLRRSC